MPKFTLVCDHSCDLDTHVVTHQFNAEVLPDVLENIEMFLKGAGYSFTGILEIVDPIDNTMITVGKSAEQHSDHFYDINRNR